MLLGLTIVSVATTGFLGVNSIGQTGQSAQQISSTSLRAQAKEYLVQLTTATAQKDDLALNQVRQDAGNVAQVAAAIYEHPQAFASQGYWRAKDKMFVGPKGQYINGKDDTSTVFVPNSVKVDDTLIANLELASYLDFQFVPVSGASPDRVAIYFISKYEFSRLYPNIDLGEILAPDYMATQDIFFIAGAPQNDPKREVVWTPIYDDPAGQGLLVTAVAPIYTSQDEFLGIIGIDLSLAKLGTSIEVASPGAGGYSFLVNNEGRAIALPRQGYNDLLGREPGSGEFGADLRASTKEWAPILTAMMNGNTGFQSVQVGKKELFVAYAPLASTKWSLATVAESANMLQAVTALQNELGASTQALVLTRILPLGVIILILSVMIGLVLTNRLVDPLQRLAVAAQEIGAGKLDFEIPQAGNDEVGVLSQAFRNMTAQLHELVGSLEQRVAERTHEVQRRAEQIATGADISRAASQLLNPNELLPNVVELIRHRFDLYYVAAFVLDEAGQNAVLRAGTGEAGQTMLERGHKLQVGGNSMVGWVCANKKARIALDVGEELVRFVNPLLPFTRSEIALPLRVGERIMGALDIQSTKEQAFDQNDITALQSMADQIAVALGNARLFQQAQSSLQELEQMNRLLSGQGWQAFMRTSPGDFAEFHQVGLTPLTQEELDFPFVQDVDAGRQVHIPLQVRNQVVGSLIVERTPDQPEWSGAERDLLMTIANQASQAMDGVRLFEESQRLAARERALSQFSARIRETLDLDTVLKVAAQETRQVLGLPEVAIRLVPPRADGNGHKGEEVLV